MSVWKCVLQLDPDRSVSSGSARDLCQAIRNGADLRVYTEFRHNEHIDPSSDSSELIRESADFRVTYLLEDRWSAGVVNLRQPVELPHSFGPRPSMSFFIYNQDGQQACSRPYLDAGKFANEPDLEKTVASNPSIMKKMHLQETWDQGTNAPSRNFIYDFEVYRFCVCDNWRELFSHTADGTVISGSLDELIEAFASGCDLKVGIKGLCSDLAENPELSLDHEVLIHVGPCYYYTQTKLFIAATQPLVRISPAIPLLYKSKNWDFGWLVVKTDGQVARLLCDPCTLEFRKSNSSHTLRWFVR